MAESELKIYPVPVKDVLFVDWGQNPQQRLSIVHIYSAAGVLVYQNDQLPLSLGKLEINTSALAEGIYMVNLIYSNGQTVSKKIIKN